MVMGRCGSEKLTTTADPVGGGGEDLAGPPDDGAAAYGISADTKASMVVESTRTLSQLGDVGGPGKLDKADKHVLDMRDTMWEAWHGTSVAYRR